MFNLIVVIGCIILILTAIAAVFRIKKIKIIEDTLQRTENQIIGEIGEGRTADEFKRFFRSISSHFKVLRNVYVKFDDETNTEIDIIVISEYGIFIVENKNCRGYINGSFSGEQWNFGYSDSKRVSFPNPVKQNYMHIRAVKKYMDLKYYNMIYSYIVFNNECHLPNIRTGSDYIQIIQEKEIYKTLWHEVRGKVLTPSEIDKIYNELYRFSNIVLKDQI